MTVTGDINTSLTAGSLAFVGAGGELEEDALNLFWDDTNNRLGIGTTGPEAALDVAGTMSGMALFAADSITTDGTLQVAGTTTLNGNVTIGDASTDTLTLTAELASHIVPSTTNTYDLGSDAKRFRDLYLSGASLHMGESGDEALLGYNDAGQFFLIDADGDGDSEFSVTDGGNIGIGIDAPDVAAPGDKVLSIFGGTANGSRASLELIGSTTGTSDEVGEIVFTNDDSALADKRIAQIEADTSPTSANEGVLKFITHNGTTLGERMRIDEDGNVGIGETDPLAKLQIGGIADAGNQVAILIDSEETTGSQDIMQIYSDVTSDENLVFRINASGSVFTDGNFNVGGADYAEEIPVVGSAEAADLMCFRDNDHVAVCSGMPGEVIAGVVLRRSGCNVIMCGIGFSERCRACS